MNFLNTGDLQYRLYRLWKYGLLSNDDKVNRFQVHLNRDYEDMEFDMAGRYTYYLLMVYVASFYNYIAPACCPALIIIFIFQYYADKFNLFYRQSFNRNMNCSLTRWLLKLFELSILIFALGNSSSLISPPITLTEDILSIQADWTLNARSKSQAEMS